ncbi:NAD(P)H-dependent flavin oxidoreductase [Mycoplasma sp. P36-A1]|uniref:NAD(P)H-dependent flavin oxidoreductase n=1 Tax=Mycoplasma sp. P36-A1 TaxID=3252900 RepID=UPI003C2BE5D0
MNKYIIKDKEIKYPIIQGGMGVGVSLEKLAGAVAAAGGIGIISAAFPGFKDKDFDKDFKKTNHNALIRQINEAKAQKDQGLVGVNIMVAMTDYEDLVHAAVEAKADIIISGAGLPLNLPGLVSDPEIILCPVVSTGRVAKLLCKKWDKTYNVIPDMLIIEGPEAGGHLGYEKNHLDVDIYDLLADVKESIVVFEEKYNRKIPIYIGGGIFDENDVKHALDSGADGVVLGTRFIATYECDADDTFKQLIIDCKQDDIQIVKSPVGMPGRALKTPLVKKLETQNIPVTKCFNCLVPCDVKTTPYCIAQALMDAANGDIDNGLFFVGAKAYKINEMTSVKELITTLFSKVK